MGKFILTESDKIDIRRMYGLIIENDNDELLQYANDYIDGHNCDEIYNDLVRYQSAVNSGAIQMDSSDKTKLDDNIDKVRQYKGFACGEIKRRMKVEFKTQAQDASKRQVLVTSMCWFSKNSSYRKTLSVCQSPSPKVDTPKIDTPKVDTPINNQKREIDVDNSTEVKAPSNLEILTRVPQNGGTRIFKPSSQSSGTRVFKPESQSSGTRIFKPASQN